MISRVFVRTDSSRAFGKQPAMKAGTEALGAERRKASSLAKIPLSKELVLGGKAGSLGARVRSQLAVDRAKVPADRARAEEELVRNPGVGQPAGDQPQHFDLPGAESGGVEFRCVRIGW